MSTTLIQCQLGTLLSNTIQNSKNNIYYLSITTQSRKATIDSSIPIFDEIRNDTIYLDDIPKDETEKLVTNVEMSQKLMSIGK